MERKMFAIQTQKEWNSSHSGDCKVFEGMIIVEPREDTIFEKYKLGIESLQKDGWSISSFYSTQCYDLIYAEKRDTKCEQRIVKLSSGLVQSYYIKDDETTLLELNQLLAQGWKIKDVIKKEDIYLLEKGEEDVISAEQQYLDRVKEIHAIKGRLRASDYEELSALRQKLGIGIDRAEEIEDLVLNN